MKRDAVNDLQFGLRLGRLDKGDHLKIRETNIKLNSIEFIYARH
jgi:hypothetical protein